MDLKLKPQNIALQNLKYHKLRSFLMLSFIILQAFTLFASSMMIDSMKFNINNITNRIGADVIVVPDKFTQELRDSLFMGEPCTIYFEKSWVEKINAVDSVKETTPQLYLSTMAATCCDAPVQLIAFDPQSDFMVKPWLSNSQKSELKKGNVYVGYNIASNIGDNIKFYNTNFIVSQKLEKTGMGN